MSFSHLLSPARIGTLELRNRLVMSPMENCYATRDGLPSERTIAYFEARAQGGAGLITLGACTVDEHHREVPNTIDFARDEVVAAHRELTGRIHAHGAKVQPQLVHPGPDGLAPYLSKRDNVGPSVIPSYLTGIPCRELAVAEIPAIVEQFADAARRVREAGYDGIELHAAHGYMLLGSFLTPTRNRRSDDYAGNTRAGRIRLICEVVAAIKRATTQDFPITLRISGYERVPGGRDLADTQAIAPTLVAAGVDAFHVSSGVIDPLTTQMVAGSHFGPAHNVSAASAVKAVVDVPVMTVGRIHDPELAEQILAEGRADLIVMGRPLIADPDFAKKLASERAREIRRCISCETCIDSMERGRMQCAVNAAAGRESELDFSRASSAKRVLVVGAGPAGLEVARVAATRGHRVDLYEREGHLGGALLMASTVHADNAAFLEYLRREVARLGVSVHLRHELDADEIVRLAPDAVVVATGGRVVVPRFAGDDLPHVFTGNEMRRLIVGDVPGSARLELPAWQRVAIAAFGRTFDRIARPGMLRSLTRVWMPVGRRVVVIGADLAAIELSEFLAERGRRVTIVDASATLAPEVGPKRRGEHMDRLDRLGVVVLTEAQIERIDRSAVVLAAGRRIPTDSVVIAGEVEPDTRLADALEGCVAELHAIGDCTGLGLIRKATEDAVRVGCAL